MAKITIKNWRGDQISQQVKKAAARGLFKAASHIQNESNNIAPKDEGTLIQTSGVDVDESNLEASIYYTQKYAARLHEHPDYNFQGGRQGKYLEKAVLGNTDIARKIVADEIKGSMGG